MIIGSWLPAQSIVSLHVRDPDSTNIIHDTETVPVAIRSRAHELTVLNPLGFFPREESATAGYWSTSMGTQYGQPVSIHNLEVRTRLRSQIPLRYFPEHSLAGFSLSPVDSTGYPLKTLMLERQQEPMVNLVYKEGDYGLGAVSVGVATDITEKTHLHLSRESESYIGRYAIDGIEIERYSLEIHHRISDSTRFLYNTLFSKDRNNWTYATPTPARFGGESSSWYKHSLRWNTSTHHGLWDYGIRLGSMRLWLNRSPAQQQLTEIQRGGWLGYRHEFSSTVQVSGTYNFLQFGLDNEGTSKVQENWHKFIMNSQWDLNALRIELNAQLLGVDRNNWDLYVLPEFNGEYRITDWLSVNGKVASTVSYAPYQWEVTPERVDSLSGIHRPTRDQMFSGGIQFDPFAALSIKAGFQRHSYSNWHRLTYNMPGARTDSTLTHTTLTGQITGLTASADLALLDWITAGLRYDVYPEIRHILPELWSRQAAVSWLHAQRYFFKNNLLLHIYCEGGTYLSREPMGWNPMFQTVTYYPLFEPPPQTSYLHLIFVGDIGPFSISTSFYNALGENLIYAIDQRPQVQIFYLGVGWQLWN